MFEFNKDVKTRDEMIFGEYAPDKYMGGVRRFEGISADLIKELMEMGYADPDEAQNSSPSIQELVDYANRYDGYLFDGYVVSLDRSDYRVSIETIKKYEDVDKDEMMDFVKEFRSADEFNIDGELYAWGD